MSFSDIAKPFFGKISHIRLALRLRQPLALLTILFAGLGVLANLAQVDPLSQPLIAGAATHPVTALCLLGVGMNAYLLKRYGRRSVGRSVIGAAVIVICVTRLMESVVTATTGVAPLALFGPFAGFSGRFTVEVAAAIGAFAVAGMLRQGAGRMGVMFLVAGMAAVFNALLQASYGLTFLGGQVGALTLVSMVCAAFAMGSIYIHRPFLRVAFLRGDVGVQTRIMAAAAVVMPWLAGFGVQATSVQPGAMTHAAALVMSLTTFSLLVILLSTSARHESSVAARRRADRDIAMRCRLDPVTGALNRFGITEVVEGAWLHFKSAGGLFGLVLIDLAYFRKLDQTFGTGEAEDVLARVLDTVQPQLRSSDAVGRWDKDEYLVLLKIKNEGDTMIVADRLRAALAHASNPFCAGLSMAPATMTICMGLSEMREQDDTPRDALVRADEALHQSKLARDPVTVGTEEAFLFDCEEDLDIAREAISARGHAA